MTKNVVVWYSHNQSAGYLDAEEVAPNADSIDFFTNDRNDIKERLMTPDGTIQYWHFKTGVQGNGSWEEGVKDERDLRHWMVELKNFLETHHERIDAVILPGKDVPNQNDIEFIKQVKERWPEVKIIVATNYVGRTDQPKPSFVYSNNQTFQDRVAVRRDSDDPSKIRASNRRMFTLHPGVDVVMIRSNPTDTVQAVRETIGVTPLHSEKVGRS